MALTKASYSMIDGAPINVIDFGADRTGVSDSTTAIQAAIDACASSTGPRTVYVPGGNYLISSTITVASGVALVGEGNSTAFSSGGQGFPSRITKAATMTTAGIRMNLRSRLEFVSVLGASGSTGNGIEVRGNYVSIKSVASNGHGGAGIKIGSLPTDVGTVNVNGFYLENITTAQNDSHGVFVSEENISPAISGGFPVFASGTPNTNAGMVVGLDSRSNGGDGLHVNNCFRNIFINSLTEVNTGYGIFAGEGSQEITFIGGDAEENNTAGDIQNNGSANHFFNLSSASADYGSAVKKPVAIQRLNTLLTRTTTAESQTVTRLNEPNVLTMLTLQSTALASPGYGVDFDIKIPDGSGTAATALGGRIRTTVQGSSGDSKVSFIARKAGVTTPMLALEPQSGRVSVAPEDDDTFNLGWSLRRWKEVYAVAPAINTSDAREKQQIRDINEAERAVALKIKGLIKAFKFNKAVEEKGDNARIHFGVIAQEVKEAFESEGLKAEDYALFCRDEWEEQKEVRTEDGESVLIEHHPAGHRYGVRYGELLAFVISAM